MKTKTNLKNKLLSLILMIAIIIASLVVMPSMTVNAFTGEAYFAPGGSSNTVNGITATATNLSGRAVTVSLSGTLPTSNYGIGSPAEVTNINSATSSLKYSVGHANLTGEYVLYARAKDGATDVISNEIRIDSSNFGNNHTLNIPGSNTLSDIRIYLGMRSRYLTMGNNDANNQYPTTATPATDNKVPGKTENAIQINGMSLIAYHQGVSQYVSTLRYEYTGISDVTGNYKAWFENGPNATTTASTGNAINFQLAIYPQEITSYHYYFNDTANGTGFYTIPATANNHRIPAGAVLRVEFTPDTGFGGDIPDVKNVKAEAFGVLTTGGTQIYTINIELNSTGVAESGNYIVSLNGDLPSGYAFVEAYEPKILHFNQGDPVSRSVKYQIKKTTSGYIEASQFNVLSVGFDFEADASFTGTQNNVSLTGFTKASYDAGIVNATLNIAGLTTLGGNYRINLKDNGNPIPGVDQRVLYFPGGYSVNRDIRYAFDFDNNAWGELNLQSVFDFVPDTSIPPSSIEHGISASGTASMAYDSQIASISVDIAGTPSVGSYKVTLYRGITPVDTRTYRFGALDAGTPITPKNFKSQIDLSQVYSGSTLTYLLESLTLGALDLSLTVDFIAAGQIGTDITKNDVTLSGMRAIDIETHTSQLSLTIRGTAEASGNHYVNVNCDPDTVPNTIEEKYYYLKAGKEIDRTLNFTVDSDDAALSLVFDFLPDTTIEDHTGSVLADGIVSKNFDTKSVSVDVKLSGDAWEGGASGNYKVYLAGYESEYRLFYLKGAVNESAKYQLDLNSFDIADFKDFEPVIVKEFYPDIVSNDVNGVKATGRVAVYDDECVVNISVSGNAQETGYYTVSLRNEDNSIIKLGEPKMYFEDGKVVDSMTFNVLLTRIDNIAAMKLNIAFTSNTSFLYEIDYYNELVIFGGEVNYGKDILYTLVKATAKFEAAPEKAKWFPTLNGRIEITKQIPKKGAPFYIALKYIGKDKDFIAKYNVGADGVIKGFAYKPGDDPSEPISESKKTPFSGNYIELKPRPVNTALKAMAKTFYNVNEQEFTNKIDATIEVLFGLDKGKKLEKKLENRYGNVFTEELAKGQSYPVDADTLPVGTPGIIRIAPVNFVNQEINNDGQLEYLSKETLASNYNAATFASLPIKFKISAQPKAPKADPTKVGIMVKNPTIITGINEKMGIVLNTEFERIDAEGEGNEGKGINYKVARTWNATPLKKNMTVKEFDDMLIASGVSASDFLNGDTYEFELRFIPIKDKKLMSAKTVLKINKEAYDNALIPPASVPEEDNED